MKFSYNWLQDHFDERLPEAEDLAKKIGLHSFELEGVDEIKINNKKDWLIDWDILPNRTSDCLCYMGMSKEIGAVLDMKSKVFAKEGLMKTNFSENIKTSDFIKLKIDDKKLVKRATKRMAVNVKVNDSPQWLKDYLEAMGQKSINNVVDITNYVMWVTGQPVHAFDYDKLAGEKDKKNIKIGLAKIGNKIVDLSGTEHSLDDTILTISDGEKNLDIAGIKGGNNSGVDRNTTRLMLSAVNFEFENIRNTSKKLKLRTDASKRFENEIPLRKTVWAMGQMSFLLKELAGAEISDEIIDTNTDYIDDRKIRCEADKINSLLGLNMEEDVIGEIFRRLDFKYEVDSGIFNVWPTEDRLDIVIWQDLAEEIGRIYGYENIHGVFPEESFSIPKINKIKKIINKIGDILIEEGFHEVYNRTIVKNGIIKLANSLNSNATNLRKNLLDGLLEKVSKNFIYDNEVKFFEIGKIFIGVENNKKDRIVNEYFSFAGIIGIKKIKEKNKEDLFYRTKGYLEKFFDTIEIDSVIWKKIEDDNFIVSITHEGEEIGKAGINFWEINLEKLASIPKKKIKYKKVSKYPRIERDVAFFVPIEVEVYKVEEILKVALPKEAIEIKLFDIYKDKENSRKSFAFKIIFQSDNKTLSDKFANEEMDKIYSILKKNNFEIR